MDPYIPAFIEAGSEIVTIHAEAGRHIDRSLQLIKSLGCKAGLSLNPATPESVIEYVIDKLDLILVMSVNPGFGGQSFIPSMIEKIKKIKQMIGNRPIEIEVDGGVVAGNAKEIAAAGANVLVAGSAVFKTSDYAGNIAALR